MKAGRRPLKRTILYACVLYTLLLCLVISLASYYTNKSAQYRGYEDYIRDVLEYTAEKIDVDDLAACIRSGEESDKFQILQHEMDRIRANFNVHFLYVIIPLHTGAYDNIMNVIAAVSDYEREFQADELVYLGMLTGDSYSPETAKKYMDAYESGKLSFFEEISEWGDDYTGLLPLYDSAGNKVAALCMDVEMQSIKNQVLHTTLVSVAATVLLGAAFAAVFLFWAGKRITDPIAALERSMARFAEDEDMRLDPDQLVLDMPEIHTRNEVASLADAAGKMSVRLRDSVKSMLSAEQELATMRILATKDPLTQVGNKTAYAQYCEGLQGRMKQDRTDFAVVMMDVNRLKEINDTYGHDKGDILLKGCCQILCDVFRHSPVYRIGGDEFAAVLMDRDYVNRDELLAQVRATFARTAANMEAEPWECFSAALGMAESAPEDLCVDDVLQRADREMYRVKVEMKAFRAD